MSRSNGSQRPITGHTVEHVFHGQVNLHGRAVGYHHESMMGGGEILEMIDPLDSKGIYRAKISVNSVPKFLDSTFPQKIGIGFRCLMRSMKRMKISKCLGLVMGIFSIKVLLPRG